MPVDHAFFEWNDSVVRDRYVFRANLGAALGDVAVADAMVFLEFVRSIQNVERMHLELGGVDKEPRTDELLVQMVVTKNVADVLAQEALDALSELLNTIRI